MGRYVILATAICTVIGSVVYLAWEFLIPKTCESQGAATASRLNFVNQPPETGSEIDLKSRISVARLDFRGDKMLTPARPCVRGEFSLNADDYTIYGENSDAPMRWATPNRTSRETIFVARLPKVVNAPGISASATRSANAQKRAETYDQDLYVLAKFGGVEDEFMSGPGKTRIYGFYDDVPDDARLAQDMCDAAAGRYKVLATYNHQSKTVEPDQMIEVRGFTDFAGYVSLCKVAE